MAGRPWIKLHTRWLTSPAHAGLKATTLGLGLLLMMVIADQGEDDDDGGRWLRKPIYHPGNCAQDIVGSALRACRADVNPSRRHVQLLVNCGSIAMNAQGHIGFPKWLKWQEHPSAKSKRKARSGHVTVNGEVEGEVEEEADAYKAGRNELQDRAAAVPTRQRPPVLQRESQLREWRDHGQPGGPGAWPEPEPPTGPRLRRLTLHKASSLLADCTAEEVHAFVHDASEAVTGGGLPPDKYTSNYLFDPRCFPSVRQQVDAWKAAQARKAEEAERERLNAPAIYTDEQKKNLEF